MAREASRQISWRRALLFVLCALSADPKQVFLIELVDQRGDALQPARAPCNLHCAFVFDFVQRKEVREVFLSSSLGEEILARQLRLALKDNALLLLLCEVLVDNAW